MYNFARIPRQNQPCVKRNNELNEPYVLLLNNLQNSILCETTHGGLVNNRNIIDILTEKVDGELFALFNGKSKLPVGNIKNTAVYYCYIIFYQFFLL